MSIMDFSYAQNVEHCRYEIFLQLIRHFMLTFRLLFGYYKLILPNKQGTTLFQFSSKTLIFFIKKVRIHTFNHRK